MNYHKNQVFVIEGKWFYNGLKRKEGGIGSDNRRYKGT